MVDDEVVAVGGFPDEDPGEGLSDLPAAEGFDPVVAPDQGSEFVEAGLAGWWGSRLVARGSVIEGERDPFPPTRYDR